MRDSHRLKEKYELSLDERQIFTLTIASLVVLGGVFMLGVVVGKKLSGEQPLEASHDILEQVDRKSAALDSLQVHDAAVLTFQDELTKKTSAPVATATVAPTVEQGEAVSLKEREAKDAVKEKEKEKRAAAMESPGASPSTLPTLPESPKPEAITTTRLSDGGGLKEAFGKLQRPPAEVGPDGAWTVQLAAYQDRAEADRFAAGLRDKGYAPYIVEVALPNRGLWFRVRMGRFPSRDAASRYMEDFRRETSIHAMVTSAN